MQGGSGWGNRNRHRLRVMKNASMMIVTRTTEKLGNGGGGREVGARSQLDRAHTINTQYARAGEETHLDQNVPLSPPPVAHNLIPQHPLQPFSRVPSRFRQ